jgi:hypothetical protein
MERKLIASEAKHAASSERLGAPRRNAPVDVPVQARRIRSAKRSEADPCSAKRKPAPASPGVDLDALFRFLDASERRSPMSISQRVSLARALRPFLEKEGRRLRGATGTAPGRRRKRSTPQRHFRARDVVSKCVGLAPVTLRKAEALIDAADRDRRLQFTIQRMDEYHLRFGTGRNVVGVWFRDVFCKRIGHSPVRVKRIYDPAFGRSLLERFETECRSR